MALTVYILDEIINNGTIPRELILTDLLPMINYE